MKVTVIVPSWKVNGETRKIPDIAYLGDNETYQVRFNLSERCNQYPNMIWQILCKNASGIIYSVPNAEFESPCLIWNITDAETAIIGEMLVQIRGFIDNHEVLHSETFSTHVYDALHGDGEPPEGYSDWVTVISEAKDSAVNAQRNAEQAWNNLANASATVETLEAGSPATVSLNDGVFHFGLPKGDQGIQGEKGDTGSKGDKGDPGYTPIKGVDYFDGEKGDKGDKGDPGDPTELINDEDETSTVTTFSAKKISENFSDVEDELSRQSGAINAKADEPTGTKSAGKVYGLNSSLEPIWVDQQGGGSADLFYVTPEDYGAVGDGETDDTQAIKDACSSDYYVCFGANKTYRITDTIEIEHDVHLYGGGNSTIFVDTPKENNANGIVVSGTLKKTTSLTTNYVSVGDTANSGNKFTLADMSDIKIGDIMVISASDQYYSYDRQYFYLGATLLISDIYDGHIYTSNSMPWDIYNSEYVTVQIYNAPTADIHDLKFVSDIDGQERWYYKYCLLLSKCKNSAVRNCEMTQFNMGIGIDACVNTLVNNVNLSKSKYDNNIDSDGYGISIISSSDTIVRRLFAICAQACITITGTYPCINTYVYDSNINSECRGVGIGLHANNYNLVVEDCILGGMSLYGTATINRCRFIRNNRPGGEDTGITIRGSHNPDYARFRITNCEFDSRSNGRNSITITRTSPQNPVQSFDNVFGMIEILDCFGGTLNISPTITEDITSNIIKYISVKNWKNCFEIYRTQYHTIEYFEIENAEFSNPYWMNRHTDDIYYDNIGILRYKSNVPQKDGMFVDIQKNGKSFIIPSGISLSCSSADTNAHYVVCGKNLASDTLTDYQVGSISGTVGGTMTRTPNSVFDNSLSKNQSGNIVFSQPNNSAYPTIYPICMFYAENRCVARIKCTFKNIGGTSGQAWRVWIIAVDCATGLIAVKQNGNLATASEDGATSSVTYGVPKNSLVMCYLGVSTVVKNSVTELIDYAVNVNDYDFDEDVVIEPYYGDSITGDGTITSVSGINNIMVQSSNAFDVKFKVNFMNDSI